MDIRNAESNRELKREEQLQQKKLFVDFAKHMDTTTTIQKVVYKGGNEKVTMIDPIYGEWETIPRSHFLGCRHPDEWVAKVRTGSLKRISSEDLVARFRDVHGDYFDYSKVDYINWDHKVLIIDPVHGEFWQVPASHLRGSGHSADLVAKIKDAQIFSAEDVIHRFVAVHGNLYDYSKVDYIGANEKVVIIDPDFGEFLQSAYDHWTGRGHPARSEYGFNPSKPARLYYLRINDRIYGTRYKIGITNRSVKKRFSVADQEKINILRRWQFEEGTEARFFEIRILRIDEHRKHRGEDVLSSGNTELFTKDVLGLDPESREPEHPIVQEILKEATEVPVNLDE